MVLRVKMLVGVLVCIMGMLALSAPYSLGLIGPSTTVAAEPVTLTLLHNNDGESGLLPTTSTVGDQELLVGGVAAFNTVAEREIAEAQNDGNAVVMVYAGDAFLASATIQCSLPVDSDKPVYDAIAQRQIPYTAHILGNHEFDYTPDFLERFIRAFETDGALTQPFLSANLDFSAEPGFDDLVDADGLLEGTPTDGRVLARSLLYTDPTTGAEFGIVGATTPFLPFISSPRDVQVVEDTVQAVQDEIDRLESQDVNKIIFVSHLQDVENDRELISQLSGVDVAVAGGGDDFLVNPDVDQSLQLLPGQSVDEIEGDYPLTQADVDGNPVYLVTSIDKYRFLGRLDVQFDADGDVIGVVSDESYPRRVVNAGPVADSLGIPDAVTPDPEIVSSVNQPVEACLQDLAATTIAQTEILLDVSRDGVRGGENNTGNLVTDAFIDAYQRYADESGLPPIGPDNPVVALQNGGGIRQNAGDVLPRSGEVPGPISQLDTIDVLPFDNFISVIQEVSPEQLLEVLDNKGTSGIDHVANLELRYNAVTDADETTYQIEDMTLLRPDGTEEPLVEDGQVVDGAPSVTVVTNSFVARNDFADNPETLLEDANGARILYEQPLREYLQTFPSEDGLPTLPAGDPRYQPFGEGRIIIQGDRTLELRPSEAINEIGTEHTVTALLRDAQGNPVAKEVVLFNVSGANTAGSGDEELRTDANGEVSFSYTGSSGGEDTITALVDLDGNGERDSTEPFAVASKTWGDATIGVSPDQAVNDVGEEHTVVVTVTDFQGDPVIKETVSFKVEGVNSVDTQNADTDENGEVSFSYVGENEGEDTITVWLDRNGNGSVDAGEPSATAGKTWEAPTAVELVSFSASTTGSQVTLTWETAVEIDNAGFNLYRATSAGGPFVQVNPALIAAEGDAVSGAVYQFSDTPGSGTFYYLLEDVEFDGTATRHGPVMVQVGPAAANETLQLYLPLVLSR